MTAGRSGPQLRAGRRRPAAASKALVRLLALAPAVAIVATAAFAADEPTARPETAPSASITTAPSAAAAAEPARSSDPFADPAAPTTPPTTGPAATPSTGPTVASAATPSTGPAFPSTGPAAPTTGPAALASAGGPQTRPTTGPTTGPATASRDSRDRRGPGGAGGTDGRDARGFQSAIPAAQQIIVPPSKPYSNEKFGILQTRSVFSRTPIRLPGDRSNERQQLTPEQTYALRGTFSDDDQTYIAFFERAGEGRVEVRLNDPIAKGRVTAIGIDGVDYNANGQVQRVAVGQNLDGQTASFGSSSGTSSGSSSGSSSSSGSGDRSSSSGSGTDNGNSGFRNRGGGFRTDRTDRTDRGNGGGSNGSGGYGGGGGSTPQRTSPSTGSGGGSSTDSGSSSTSGTSGGGDLLEQMRKRRAEQMGK